MAKRKNENLPAKSGSNLPVANIDDQMLVDAQASSGFEDMDADDLAIPFLVILQALSPQVRGQGKIEGAYEGDFFNTVTNEVIRGGLKIIPCAYEKAYVEWVLRENGGGFVRKHSDQAILEQTSKNDKNQDILTGGNQIVTDDQSILEQTGKNDKNQDILTSGNQIVTTAYHYCLLVKDDGSTEQVVLGLTSTQLKKSRRWNSTMMSMKIKFKGKSLTPPMYSHIYEAVSMEESNDHGTWSSWAFGNPEKITDMDLYIQAKEFHDNVVGGSIRTAPPPSDMAGHAATATDANYTETDDSDAF